MAGSGLADAVTPPGGGMNGGGKADAGGYGGGELLIPPLNFAMVTPGVYRSGAWRGSWWRRMGWVGKGGEVASGRGCPAAGETRRSRFSALFPGVGIWRAVWPREFDAWRRLGQRLWNTQARVWERAYWWSGSGWLNRGWEAAAVWVHGESQRAAPAPRVAVAGSGWDRRGWHARGPGARAGRIGTTARRARATGAGDVCVWLGL